MTKRDIIVIGASAGGVYALKSLVAGLPANFAASIFVVQHVSPFTTSRLPDILSYAGALPATHPQDGDPIQPGHIYVAPPDHHLLIERDRILVKKGPKENRFRPSIDALFRSAAYSYGQRVIGVVLTGLLDDGTSGLWSVKRLGGTSIVQTPKDALYPNMPKNALQHVDVDYQVPIDELAPLLGQLVEKTVSDETPITEEETSRIAVEVKIAAQKDAFNMGVLELGKLTPLTCPECSGSLVRIQEGRITRYRCHTGHAYTANTLLTDVTGHVEESLWKAVRGLEEAVILLDQSSAQFAESGNADGAHLFHQQAQNARQRANRVRMLIFEQVQLSEDLASDEPGLTSGQER